MTHDPATGQACLLLVNRAEDAPLPVSVDLTAFGPATVIEHVELAGDGTTVNTPSAPDAVAPRRVDGTRVQDGRLEVVLPPASWSMLRVAVPQAKAGEAS